jgi:hypothetical protein
MSPAEGNFDCKGSLRAGRRRREGSGTVDQGQTFGVEIGFAARPQQNNRRHASGSIENKPNRSDPFGALKCALGIMLHTLQHSADNEAVAHRFTAAFGWQRDGGGTKNDPGPNRKATPASLRPPSGFQRRAAPFPFGRLHARFLGPHCLCETPPLPMRGSRRLAAQRALPRDQPWMLVRGLGLPVNSRLLLQGGTRVPRLRGRFFARARHDLPFLWRRRFAPGSLTRPGFRAPVWGNWSADRGAQWRAEGLHARAARRPLSRRRDGGKNGAGWLHAVRACPKTCRRPLRRVFGLEQDPKKLQTFWIRSCEKTNR